MADSRLSEDTRVIIVEADNVFTRADEVDRNKLMTQADLARQFKSIVQEYQVEGVSHERVNQLWKIFHDSEHTPSVQRRFG